MELLNNTRRINQDVKRNIVYLDTEKNLFQDLCDEDNIADVAQLAVTFARSRITENLSDFYYTAAIEYPYKTEPFMSSRYSDGSFPVWYGSMTIKTSIHETAFHAMQKIFAIDNFESEKIITLSRGVFDVHCNGLFIDLVRDTNIHKKITDDNYSFTQKIGLEISQNNFPGVLAPSARLSGGTNVNVFQQELLSNPRFILPLKYCIHTDEHRVVVDCVDTDLCFEITYH